MSSDSEKFHFLKKWLNLAQMALEDKRDSVRLSKIAQNIISERQQEERALDMNRQAREVIDNLILKSMSGEINFCLDNHALLRYENELNTCKITSDYPVSETQSSNGDLKAVLSNHDFYNSVELPLSRQDQVFFFNLWKEKLQARDQALLRRFANDILKN
ncbi:hypothetical protein A2662_04575 [Candidatus Giovannonibacteria bacterium RIFCSPHIGHO2_01_FULL_45_33]|uniref:Uncharacterized protein n=1 Tax=Candidatus Giovannonibacteria bacterium RIFCSPLOWO2_01_FULL_45_34 TaxID=1798351 RepID=A0A1F5WZM4_9BACT|nr:MAG: hypothetical protein A2662_04575 [Candidatus Giovannonibacteria bacterium RIFCSPHIGHO2_01_FULL_45_33]OGF69821.1 MAG: hypothetical protein A3C73_03550 [Candidatus Giovannonibacteria bacterium RIFCSPHIGHO2_02_FULL_44_11]OGF81053.1 MAG: hypothetical protein A2930_03290 [Candidatus Giovannonibacteria bacterium RIFCSPLOWO2_01_FULL_45_34]